MSWPAATNEDALGIRAAFGVPLGHFQQRVLAPEATQFELHDVARYGVSAEAALHVRMQRLAPLRPSFDLGARAAVMFWHASFSDDIFLAPAFVARSRVSLSRNSYHAVTLELAVLFSREPVATSTTRAPVLRSSSPALSGSPRSARGSGMNIERALLVVLLVAISCRPEGGCAAPTAAGPPGCAGCPDSCFRERRCDDAGCADVDIECTSSCQTDADCSEPHACVDNQGQRLCSPTVIPRGVPRGRTARMGRTPSTRIACRSRAAPTTPAQRRGRSARPSCTTASPSTELARTSLTARGSTMRSRRRTS